MEAGVQELEGAWEDILARASELEGRKVHLTVLPEDRPREPRSFWESRSAEDLFAEQGIAPVSDVQAFLRSLPHPGPGDELWDAVSADRAARRTAGGAGEC